MGAPKGNQFWKARSSHGAKPKYCGPVKLWDACIQYFEWVADNPLKEERVFHNAGMITRADVDKMRAMTIGGLCLFIGISHDTWENYRANRKDLFVVITRAEEIIRQQKFEGAAAELLNANIIARDLKLVDRKEVAAKLTDATDEELSNRINGLLGARNARDYPDTPE